MDSTSIADNPLAVFTFITAPALLTNATSNLVASTTSRWLKTRQVVRDLLAETTQQRLSHLDYGAKKKYADRVEKQAGHLLHALFWTYLALGAFSGATLVLFLGTALEFLLDARWFIAPAILSSVLGLIGVGGLIVGSIRLFLSSKLSLDSIREEADVIRKRCSSA